MAFDTFRVFAGVYESACRDDGRRSAEIEENQLDADTADLAKDVEAAG